MTDSLVAPPAGLPVGSIVDTYLRDSGGESQDRSVPRQLEAIKAYCLKHNLNLRNIYKDVAKSGGSTAGRDDFDRMISATRDETQRPNGILLWNYARFARDLDDSTYYKALLRSKRNIIIHSLTDQIPQGPYGRFVEILIDISNEEKRRQTSIDTKDGLRSIVAQGAVPGVPPRGMKREPIITINPRTGQERKNHRWIPDPKYIHRIQKAFQLRAQRTPLNTINKQTKLFATINSYLTFFSNKIYYGTLVYAGIEFEKYCEPIVKKELWDKVQLIQAEYVNQRNIKAGDANHPRRVTSEFLLSGIARHSKCGSSLYGHTSHQKNGSKYQSYFCTLAYRKRGACVKERIPKEILENAVISALIQNIFTPQNVDEMHRLLRDRQTDSAIEQSAQRKEIQTRLAANKKQLTNITNAIAESGSSSTLLSRLNDLEHEQLELTLTLNELKEQAVQPIPEYSTAELQQMQSAITAALKSKDEPFKKTLLKSLISHIEVERQDDKLRGTIYYLLPPDTSAPTSPPDDDSPDDGGNQNVPSPHHPSGPPDV